MDRNTASSTMEKMPSVTSTATSVLNTFEKRSPISLKYRKPMTVEVDVNATPTMHACAREKNSSWPMAMSTASVATVAPRKTSPAPMQGDEGGAAAVVLHDRLYVDRQAHDEHHEQDAQVGQCPQVPPDDLMDLSRADTRRGDDPQRHGAQHYADQ